MTLTALIKISDRFGEAYFDRINSLLAPYETSCVLQAQQRACEYTELMKNDYAMIREQILDRMPPLDIDNAKARRAEDESGSESEEDTQSEGDMVTMSHPSKPAAEPTSLMDDLLGLDLGVTSTKADTGSNDFSGVMDILDTISTTPTAPAPAPADDPFNITTLPKPAGSTSPFDILDLSAAAAAVPSASPVPASASASAPAPAPDDEFKMSASVEVPVASPAPTPTCKYDEWNEQLASDSLVAFDEDGVKIVFKMKKGEDDSDTIIKAIISNSNPDDLEEFTLQAAVPKVIEEDTNNEQYMKVQMKPISDPIIPGYNEDVSTQLIRIKNNAFGEVGVEGSGELQKASVMKLRITYDLNGEMITKTTVVDDIPDSF